MIRNFFRRRPLVLVVCSANICRSPVAAGALRALLKAQGAQTRWRIESAGTSVGAPGHRPDPRMARLCAEAGISLRGESASQLFPVKANEAALIVCMEHRHADACREMLDAGSRTRVQLLGHWLPGEDGEDPEIADPYYANGAAIQAAFDLITAACSRLARELADVGVDAALRP